MPVQATNTETAEQWLFIEQSLDTAQEVLEVAFDNAPEHAAEVFPDKQQKERVQVLAHKLIDYVVQADAEDKEIAGIQSVADSLIELAPGNFRPRSRRRAKAQTALDEWFDLEHTGRRIIGASLMSIIDHHEKRTLQRSGELRNKYLGSETEPPEYLFTTSQGLELYQLRTKPHLEQESAITGHCVGTGTWYSDRLAKGKDYYFSLRDPNELVDETFQHTTFQYDIERKSVTQIKGRKNTSAGLGSPHFVSVAEALVYIRDTVAKVSQSEFRVPRFTRGTVTDTNLELVRGEMIEELRVLDLIIADKIPLKIHINEDFDPEILDDVADILDHYELREFVFDSSDSDVLAKVMEKLDGITCDLTFSQLEVAHGLEGLERVEGSVNFPVLVSSEGLESLREITGNANFPALIDASGLSSLHEIGGDADFSALKSAAGLSLLEKIGSRARFGALETSTGLSSLRIIGKAAHFFSLRESSSLTALEYIGARAHLKALESALGLENLTHIGGRTFLDSLTTSQGLQGIEYIGGTLYAGSLSDNERRQLNKYVRPKKKRKR